MLLALNAVFLLVFRMCNSSGVGLARTMYIYSLYFIYGIFGRKITKYVYGSDQPYSRAHYSHWLHFS